MNKTILSQLLAMAMSGYYDVLMIIFEMLRHNADTLGLMVPGLVGQLAVNNGAGVTQDGVPLFRAVVMKRRNDKFQSPMEFGQAIQGALDAVCYANCLNRLYLLRVENLGKKYVGLTLTWGNW